MRRQPAVASQFYSSDPAQLRKDLSSLVEINNPKKILTYQKRIRNTRFPYRVIQHLHYQFVMGNIESRIEHGSIYKHIEF